MDTCADMVKWLSSEVSNLMSWVRLPLSAPHLIPAKDGIVQTMLFVVNSSKLCYGK